MHANSPLFLQTLWVWLSRYQSHWSHLSFAKAEREKNNNNSSSQLLALGKVDHTGNSAGDTDPCPLPQTPVRTFIIQAAFFRLCESVAPNFYPFEDQTLFLLPINCGCLKFDRKMRSFQQRRAANGTRYAIFSAC